jgi:hypothetical protein
MPELQDYILKADVVLILKCFGNLVSILCVHFHVLNIACTRRATITKLSS